MICVLEMGSNNFFDGFEIFGISPRCAYFLCFNRFSKYGQKVNEMPQTEATVTSGVKNWYIILFYWVPEVP